jgi:hypothetical protein
VASGAEFPGVRARVRQNFQLSVAISRREPYVASMHRQSWTDERLDDMSRRMDQGFERVDCDLREIRGEIRDLRSVIHRFGAGLFVAIVVATFLQHSV